MVDRMTHVIGVSYIRTCSWLFFIYLILFWNALKPQFHEELPFFYFEKGTIMRGEVLNLEIFTTFFSGWWSFNGANTACNWMIWIPMKFGMKSEPLVDRMTEVVLAWWPNKWKPNIWCAIFVCDNWLHRVTDRLHLELDFIPILANYTK